MSNTGYYGLRRNVQRLSDPSDETSAWETVAPVDMRVGDIFKMFEPYGSLVIDEAGQHQWKVKSPPVSFDGVIELDTSYVSDAVKAAWKLCTQGRGIRCKYLGPKKTPVVSAPFPGVLLPGQDLFVHRVPVGYDILRNGIGIVTEVEETDRGFMVCPADDATAELFIKAKVSQISSLDVIPIPALRLEDVVVVTNDPLFIPKGRFVIPYVVSSNVTEGDLVIYHKAICETWRDKMASCGYPMYTSTYFSLLYEGMYGIRNGRLHSSVYATQSPSRLTHAQRDDLYANGLNAVHEYPGRGMYISAGYIWENGRVVEIQPHDLNSPTYDRDMAPTHATPLAMILNNVIFDEQPRTENVHP